MAPGYADLAGFMMPNSSSSLPVPLLNIGSSPPTNLPTVGQTALMWQAVTTATHVEPCWGKEKTSVGNNMFEKSYICKAL